MSKTCTDQYRQRGAGLIEVLVAVLVMSFGLLAMAAMSGAALVHQKSAQMRLTGVSLTQFYAERARLNVYGFDLGGYDLDIGTLPNPQKLVMVSDAQDEAAARAVAAFDQQTFLNLVAATLPEGQARVVARPSAESREIDVWLLWRDTPAGGNNGLNAAASQQCPTGLADNQRNGRSCMHFRVGL